MKQDSTHYAHKADASQLRSWFDQALTFHQGGMLAQALQLYERAQSYQPRQASARQQSALARAQVDDEKVAQRWLARAIGVDPSPALTMLHRAQAQLLLQRWEDGLNSLGLAIELMPGLSQAHQLRLNTLNRLNRLAEGQSSVEQLLRARPDDADLLYTKGQILSALGKRDEALQAHLQAVKFDPGHIGARLMCAWLHMLEGDYVAARAWFDSFARAN
jgi:tetratricopeptide (TPR) repeat protein